MTDALDDIRFIADSQHRSVAIESLAVKPRSRGELRELTGASSATVGRLATAFEERGWLVRDGSHYSLTKVGEFVAQRFADLHRDMELARELDELLPHVPIEEIGITVSTLSDAFVTRATHANPFGVVSRVRELERDSQTARSLTDFFPEPCIDGRYESIVNGTQTFEAVFAPIVIETAMASESASKFAAIVESDQTDIYVYGSPITQPVMVHDGVACLVVRDDANISIGMIETADSVVVEWVTALFAAARADATLLTPEHLTQSVADVLAQT